MAAYLPDAGSMNLTQLHIGVSHFAKNGFAALGAQVQVKQEGDQSDGADSLFGDDIGASAGDASGSDHRIKLEDARTDIIDLSHPGVSTQQPFGLDNANMSKRQHPNVTASTSHGNTAAAGEVSDDDDVIVVEEASIPLHLKAKFKANPWRPVTPDIELVGVRVKQEPRSPQRVINLDEDGIVPGVKQEQQNNNDAVSLFGGSPANNDLPKSNPKPRAASGQPAAPPHGAQEDDEAMFVDEVRRPGAPRGNTPATMVPTPAAPPPVLAAYATRNPTPTSPPVSAASTTMNPTPAAPPVLAAAGASSANAAHDAPSDNNGNSGDGVGRDVEVVQDLNDPFGEGEGGGDANNGDGADNGDDATIMGNENHEEDGDDDEAFIVGDDQELSDGEQPRARRRRPTASRKKKGKQKVSSARDNNKGVDEAAEPTKEDLEDEQLMVQTELSVINRRKATGRAVQGDAERMKVLTRRNTVLQKKLTYLRNKSLEGMAQEELQKMMEQEDSQDEDEAQPASHSRGNGQANSRKEPGPATRIPQLVRTRTAAEGGPSAQKRKWQLPPDPKELAPRPRKKNKRDYADVASTTEAILNSIRTHDPIMARAQMDDYQIFDKIEATTVMEQMNKLREQISANPAVNERRVKADVKQLESARKLFGGKKYCKAFHGQWKITGLKKPLHHYQLVGAGWMLHRELDKHGPFGGILADSVGLGKTVEAIACILGHRLPEKDKEDGKFGTLVVVPSNLLAQWQDEIDECCGAGIHVVHYHTSKHNRIRMANVQRADIVVTTYHEVTKAYPRKEQLEQFEDLPVDERNARFNEMLGKIFHIEWHRVILDEAHLIKNHRSHTSKACTRLLGKYRWALTGTPVHNGLHELYPYMQFLRAADGETFKEFKAKYAKGTVDSTERIKSLVEDVMMNRQISTLFLGKALFPIPMTHPLPNNWIRLSDEETIIYRRIEHKVRELLNAALGTEDVDEKKRVRSTFFSIAIRLRQAVSHPFLLYPMMRDFFEFEDMQEIKEKMDELKVVHPNRPFVAQIGTWCESLVRGKLVAKVTEANGSRPFGRGDHGMEFNMAPHFEKLQELKTMGAAICGICTEPFTRPRKTKCGHVFCLSCIEDLLDSERDLGNSDVDCPTCHTTHPINEFFNRFSLHGGSQSQSRRRQARRSSGWNEGMRGNDWRGYQPLGDEESAEFLKECERNIHLAVAPSAKTTMVKDIILGWQKKYPDDKIIVFTQWVMVGRILGRVLEQEGIDFLYFFGEMDRTEKEDNLNVFRSVANVKVLVASLKCGGQGLNLTCANRVIMIDPWWNSALEFQGYGRVFRMGQTKETYYVRLLTRNTIDGRMAKLQARKVKEINGVITDYDSTRTLPKLEEVAQLFGRVSCDANGRPVTVEEDYDTDEEGGAENRVESPEPDVGLQGGNDGDNGGGSGGHDGEQPGFQRYGDSRVGGYGIQDLV